MRATPADYCAKATHARTDVPADVEGRLRPIERTLRLAEDESLPVLERVRLLAVFAGQLDAFFMVCVPRLSLYVTAGPLTGTAAPQEPSPVAGRILDRPGELMRRHAACYRDSVLPALAARGIEILRWHELSSAERAGMDRMFADRVLPLLTPLAVDPAHPFPYISGLSLNLAVAVSEPQVNGRKFARLKVPALLPRFLEVSPRRFTALEDVIGAHLGQLFEGTDVLEHFAFRVTRSQDLQMDPQQAASVPRVSRPGLPHRPSYSAVRLEVEEPASDEVLDRLVTELAVPERAAYRLDGPLDLTGLHAIADIHVPEVNGASGGRTR